MNTIKKTLLAGAIITALAGCSEDDYKVEKDTANNTAPVHAGDIVMTVAEIAEYQIINLLAGAADADGDYISIQNFSASDITDTNSPVDVTNDLKGFVLIEGVVLGIRPTDLKAELDTGMTRTVQFSYDISDGVTSVPRMITVSITGEDFAPVADEALIGNFTKDAGNSELDLLAGVVDADEEPLTASELVASTSNPFILPATIVDNNLVLDIDAVKADIPDGELVAFNFSYKVSDHRFTIDRDITVNVLGVKDVPGAPLFAEYFLSESVDETDTVQVVDLAVDAVDREGDAVVVSNVMLNGAPEMPFGVMLDGNNLTIDPHAFFNDVAAGETMTMVFTYNVSDDQGNTSDGERQLTYTINGVQTNMIAAAGFNADFEDPAHVGPLDQTTNPGGFEWGSFNSDCTEKEVRMSAARTGDYGFRMSGSFCQFNMNGVIPALEDNQKYAMSYWLRNEETSDPNGNPFVPLFAGDVGDTGLDNRFWWGPRYFDQGLNQWFEHLQLLNTNDSGNWDGYETFPINFGLLKYAGAGKHDIDDMNLVKYGHFDTAAHDLILDDAGLFENGETITSSVGVAEIRDASGEDEDVDNKLFVDTTGAAEGVKISLPIKAGAISPSGRYAVSVTAMLINHDAIYGDGAEDATTVVYSASLSNGTDFIAANGEGSTTGSAASSSDIIITEEFGRSGTVDWSQENMTLELNFTEANAQYYIDNVRIIAIP